MTILDREGINPLTLVAEPTPVGRQGYYVSGVIAGVIRHLREIDDRVDEICGLEGDADRGRRIAKEVLWEVPQHLGCLAQELELLATRAEESLAQIP
jgi:hypothetical protein